MVGYSDSAKDAGRLAACWAQYTAQEAMAKVADKYGIELTFFHGKVSNLISVSVSTLKSIKLIKEFLLHVFP